MCFNILSSSEETGEETISYHQLVKFCHEILGLKADAAKSFYKRIKKESWEQIDIEEFTDWIYDSMKSHPIISWYE